MMTLRFACLTAAIGLAVVDCRTQEPPPPTPQAGPQPSPTPSETPPPRPPLSRRQLLEGLSEQEIGDAIEKIRAVFLDPSATSEEALQRAALEGLLARWAPGLELREAAHTHTPEPFPFLAEILDAHIAYVRPGTLSASTLSQFDATLAGLSGKGVNALILDLRGVRGPADYDTAAEFARRLSPKGRILMTLQRPSARQERIFTSHQDPAFSGLLVVLTDPRTGSAAEALAGALREAAGAMIVGSDTSGAAVEFEEIRLGSSTILRVAASQVLLPGGKPIFPGGVKPDIAVSMPPDTLDHIFRESTEKGVSQFVFETERRRMNEAALVANTNPEIDAAQAQQRDRGRPPALRDIPLQRAVDLVTAVQFYGRSKN